MFSQFKIYYDTMGNFGEFLLGASGNSGSLWSLVGITVFYTQACVEDVRCYARGHITSYFSQGCDMMKQKGHEEGNTDDRGEG